MDKNMTFNEMITAVKEKLEAGKDLTKEDLASLLLLELVKEEEGR